MRAAGYRTEWIWTTERGGQTGMWHVHLIQTGDFIPQRVLQDWWGGRIVDIRKAYAPAGAYISKSAGLVAQYVSKGGRGDLEAALAVNGGRLHHWSRGWWDGLTVREYRARVAGSDPRDCVMIYAPDARRAAQDNGSVTAARDDSPTI